MCAGGATVLRPEPVAEGRTFGFPSPQRRTLAVPPRCQMRMEARGSRQVYQAAMWRLIRVSRG